MAKTMRATKAPGVVVSYDPSNPSQPWRGLVFTVDPPCWRVTYGHRRRGLFHTQRNAVEYGRCVARARRCDLTVMGRNGKIRIKNSYGRDPRATKG